MVEVKRNEQGKANGHICPNCGEEHTWPAYVYAHWGTPLEALCDCGFKVEICRGIVIISK